MVRVNREFVRWLEEHQRVRVETDSTVEVLVKASGISHHCGASIDLEVFVDTAVGGCHGGRKKAT
jgi:hypothetical protein